MDFCCATASDQPAVRLSDYFDEGETDRPARTTQKNCGGCDILTASLTPDSCKLFQHFKNFSASRVDVRPPPARLETAFMTRGIGALFLGAAVMSIFVP